jgi:hypothetical protein
MGLLRPLPSQQQETWDIRAIRVAIEILDCLVAPSVLLAMAGCERCANRAGGGRACGLRQIAGAVEKNLGEWAPSGA